MLYQDGKHTRIYWCGVSMRLIAGVLSVALFCCGLFVIAQAQNAVSVGPFSPCSAFGTAAGTCAQGGVITAGGPTGAATTVPVITYNAAGQLTAVSTAATGVTTNGTAAVGQLPGTTTNDAAAAGKVGELVVSGSSTISALNSAATVTYTIASPGVVNWTTNPYYNAGATGHGCGSVFVPSTTGAVPTGLTAGTPTYVTCDASLTANAFHVSSSVANAIAGTAINFTGSQSGTQTGQNIVALSAGNAIDVGGMSLTAGDWDVEMTALYSPAASTSITLLAVGVVGSTASFGTQYSAFFDAFAAEIPTANFQRVTMPGQISLSGTTTVFCDMRSTFSISTMAAGGFCRARRIR
jgi:hypothetical protein